MRTSAWSVRSVPDEGVGDGNEPREAILAGIVTAVVLLVVAAVLPRSRDAWGIPAKGAVARWEGQAPSKRTNGIRK